MEVLQFPVFGHFWTPSWTQVWVEVFLRSVSGGPGSDNGVPLPSTALMFPIVLGLVAMALIVAVFVPSIGVSLAIASVLGTVLAIGLILWRRRTGPMPSSGRRPGANTMLAIESPERPSDDERDLRDLRRTATPDPRPLAAL